MLHQPITTEGATEADAAAIPALARGWTPALKATFLDHLATRGNVRASCARVGLSTEGAYRLRRRDTAFARGWAAALTLARDASVQVLADRAIDGVEEKIFYRGELIDTRRRYDARLLLAHIARLDRAVDEAAAGPDAARFDELLARIAGEEPPCLGEEPPCLGEEPPCLGEEPPCAGKESSETHKSGDSLLPPDRETFAYRAADAAGIAVVRHWDEASTRNGRPRKLTRAECEACEAELRAAVDRAHAEAAAQWDEWLVRARDTVDALAGWPGTPPLPGLPGNPLPPSPPAETAETGAGLSFPRTPSTVSTSALARGLAGPATGFVPPAISRSPLARRRD